MSAFSVVGVGTYGKETTHTHTHTHTHTRENVWLSGSLSALMFSEDLHQGLVWEPDLESYPTCLWMADTTCCRSSTSAAVKRSRLCCQRCALHSWRCSTSASFSAQLCVSRRKGFVRRKADWQPSSGGNTLVWRVRPNFRLQSMEIRVLPIET